MDNKTAAFSQTLNDFYGYLKEILKMYQDVIPVLKEELNSILQDNIEELNENLRSQQVLLLKTRNFNNTIHEYQKKLGIQARNLSEMIMQIPEKDLQMQFYALLGEFDLTMTEVNFYKEKCRVLLQSKLYTIEKTLSKQENQKDITTYDQNASEVQGTLFPKSFETRI
ncbi:flagellar protein FlgN [Sinanaerobacter chloroacetimidivorans]|jgi:hypothetical protein|uniref:FlgN protein n=1 Tax=Sinanaerobacter chloroacetimidivorans TaxID=2818044 RepID=A0A8J7W0W7_9FIRM|nr:flagellar protein FlgN [Sinanaerobacter chloroacetimidivorans]MBR0597523.1 hypothetical protein [Sinanaerobacter chloroacetimidivorans]